MSSKKKNLAKQFQQNKVNRVVKSEKRYNKEKRSKSDEAYIKGDYKSSVSLRSYGVKKALANGEKVSGYGDDYIDTKGMKRSNYVKKQNGENPYEAKYLYVGGKPNTITSKDGSKFQTRTRYLTDEEKKSYENTGELYHKNYRKAKSYLDTERHEGGKFSDRLKTFDGNKIKWDGLETAKYNQKDGKHLQNLGHYAIGLGKDLIADPVVDFLKGVDRYESAITNGVYAGVEQLSNIADGKGATKDLIKDVVKHSLKESDETGWGTSSADNWRNMAKRNGAEISPLEDKILGATGFVADILNPIDLGGKVSNVLKGTAKGAKNALKGVSSATDVMSEVPGFVPKSLTDVRGKNFINKTNKSSGASDDVFFGLKTNKSLDNTEVDRRLNNAYDVAMSKREPIKTGKPKVDSFIEKLRRKGNSEESGMFPYNTHQIRIGQEVQHSPQPISNIDITDGLGSYTMGEKSNAGRAEYKPKGRYSEETGSDMASRLDLERELDEIDEVLESYNGDYELEDKYMDTLKKHRPDLYEAYMKVSDESEYVAQLNETKKLLNDNYTKSMKEKNGDFIKDQRSIQVDKSKINKSSLKPLTKRKPIVENAKTFQSRIFDYVNTDLTSRKNIELHETSKNLKSLTRKITKSNQDKAIKAINKSLFNGEEVIRNNVPKKDLRQFAEYLQDSIAYQMAINSGEKVVKIHDKKGSLVDFKLYDKNGKLRKLEDKSSLFARNMVDSGFEDKSSLKANALGVKHKSEITKPLEKLEAKRKKGTITNEEEAKRIELKKREELWNKIHEETRDLEFDEFNKYVEENFPHLSQNKSYNELVDDRASMNKGTSDMSLEDKIAELRRDDSIRSDRGKREIENLEEMYDEIKKNGGRTYDERMDSISNSSSKKYARNQMFKDAGLKYIDYNKITPVTNLKQEFKVLNRHKDINVIFDNMKKLIDYQVKGNVTDDVSKLIDEEKAKYIKTLGHLGVKKEAYFNELKQHRLKAIERKIEVEEGIKLRELQHLDFKIEQGVKDGRNAKIIERLKLAQDALSPKDAQTIIDETSTPLEKFKVIRKSVSENENYDKIAKLVELQDEYERVLNSTNPEELFMSLNNTNNLNKLAPQSGDNISKISKPNTYVDDMSDVINGTESVFDYLNPENRAKHIMNNASIENGKQVKMDGRTLNKKYTQTKDGYIPQIKEETPLDSVGKTTDEQLNLFDKMFGKTPKEEKAINNIPKDMQEQKLQELDEKIAKRMTPQRMAEILGEPLEDVLKNANKPVNINGEEIAQGWRKNADKTGVPNGVEWEDLFKEDKGIKDVFEELSSEGVDATKQPPKERPQNMQPSLYKKWLNAWKKGVTIYNPGWHMQNFFQNKAQNYFALGNKAFMPQTDAKNILKTIKGKDAKSVNINGLDNKELARLAEELGVVDSFGDDIQIAQNGIFGAIENSKPMQKLQEIEKNARLHHWLEQIKNGMTPEQASRSVNKYLYDYSKENKFDRAMKHVDPFWTFHKNNARMLTTSALEHPSRMNNIMRANRGLEGDIPEEYKQNEDAMYREYQDPTKTYTDHKDRQYNYLYNQDMFSDISDAIPLSQDSLVGKLNPLIQIALRTAKGEGKFGNKIVDSDKSIEDGWNELLYEDAGYNKVSSNVAIKDALLDVNPILPGLVETIDAINADKYKANNGGMPQEIADKRALNEWIKLITGHKGNWYRNTK